MSNKLPLFSIAIAILIGLFIGYVDSRPTWDDTGITAGSIFLVSALIVGWQPRFGWYVGVCVGAPVFIINLVSSGTWESVVALAIGLFGAFIGKVMVGLMKPQGA